MRAPAPATPTPAPEEFHAGANADLQLGSRRNLRTCDDTGSTPLLEVLADPGPDGIYNTTDDTIVPLTNYQRTISIYALYDANHNQISSLRGVTITISYSTPRIRRRPTF